jgi:hypothetical protein
MLIPRVDCQAAILMAFGGRLFLLHAVIPHYFCPPLIIRTPSTVSPTAAGPQIRTDAGVVRTAMDVDADHSRTRPDAIMRQILVREDGREKWMHAV